ncbi:sensor histidine kinase [Actinocatenispora comari]|uniref:histidine kinase n=1 Tax=Actinocatenispora comari TaxID=2807577 RepID=A0A8J4AB57_9ACTN|nr:sensor histidine kinase [Actinocatenispora comari]GIL28154.1 histidine kinase [Actinocatenispora comari]
MGVTGGAGTRWRPREALSARQFARSLRYLSASTLAGFGGLLVLVAVLLVALLCIVGVGLLLTGVASGLLHRWCDRERVRVGRLLGRHLGSPYLPANAGGSRLADGTVPRDLAVLLQRIVVGIRLGLLTILLPLTALQAVALVGYWWAMPEGKPAEQLFPVTSWWWAAASGLIGIAGLMAWWAVTPMFSIADARLAELLLTPTHNQQLRLRVQLEQQRRHSALDVHSAELRRIERDLHDAAQNRLVAVSMFVGTAQRQLDTGVGDVAETLDKAQQASRDALAEMRRIIRGIYPPTLAEEGLVPSLGLLADRMPIPTRLHVASALPTPASVGAAVYFSIAELLTNVSKHSDATECVIEVSWSSSNGRTCISASVTDNGRGGADRRRGTGLVGIERRVEALGGTLAVTSPQGGPTSGRMELPCES